MQEYTELEQSAKVNISVWKRLLGYAWRHKGTLIFAIAVMVAVAVIDILYPLLASYAIDFFVEPKQSGNIFWFGLIYGILIFLQSVGVLLFVAKAGQLEMGMAYDIRKEGFRKLQELSMSFYDKTAVGYILARMVSDIGRISEMIAWALVDIMWAATFIIGVVAALFLINVRLALAALAVVPVLMAVSVVFQKLILKWQRRVRRTNSKITSAFNEGILGAMTTKTLVREQKNEEEFTVLTGEMRQNSIKAATLSAIFMPIVIILGSAGTALAMCEGAPMVIADIVEIGSLVAVLLYTRQMFEPVQQIARILAEMQTAQASAERVLSLLDTPAEITERPEVVSVYGDNFCPNRDSWPELCGKIEFRDVTFRYIPDEDILTRFNLTIEAGETVALVGETGAGKSTIVNLACRFYEPTEGSVLIDGTDYRERSSLWLEESLGYVLQTPHLFSGTIADNIRYGKRGASDEEVIRAAKVVNAHDFIAAQPKGYDTEVGEEGGRLSTGQKQLISFARVILADPRIFVLDEATSSIDTETEMMIQNAISNILKNRTSIIVAHRLSTIRSADRIYVIGDGRILEEGTHDSLMKQKGRYFDLYMKQFKEEQTTSVIR